MKSRLSAIILAAGFSSRMGVLKGLLPLDGQTLLERCISLFHDSDIQDVIVVTGYRAEEISRVAQAAGARVTFNSDFAGGMYGSVQTGIRQVTGQYSGFFLLPVDIPLVRTDTIRLLTRAFTNAPTWLHYPVFNKRRGHPPLIHTDLIPIILEQRNPEGGLRSLFAQIETWYPEQVCEVQTNDKNIHIDFDTPEDFRIGCIRYLLND